MSRWIIPFQFEATLNCTTVKASLNTYESENFGLVTDSEHLIKEKAVAENIEFPTEITVYVEENTDKDRSTFFNVYSLNLNYKDVVKNFAYWVLVFWSDRVISTARLFQKTLSIGSLRKLKILKS